MLKACLVCALLTAAALPVATTAAEPAAAGVDAARGLAHGLVEQLGARLQAAIETGGPSGAVGVCAHEAPAIAGELSRRNGTKITRVSLKTRNPLLGTPDAWEQAVLLAFEERLTRGEPIAWIEFAEVVREPAGEYLRYMKALPVQALCLGCHGAPESIDPKVRARLQQDYPADRATGYRLGQIRGAISVKQPR